MSNWPITILFSIAVLLGLATEGVILYAQKSKRPYPKRNG